MTVVLEARRLRKDFPVRRGLWRRSRNHVVAVADVSFAVAAGRTLGLVGESGCGKSTTARLVLRLVEPSSGSVLFDGIELTGMPERDLRRIRPRMQMVFQDPFASLDPRSTVADIVGEPVLVHWQSHRAERLAKTVAALERVGMGAETLDRHPYEFSGGQRQRIAIARALISEPDLVVCDEPVSALDVSTQSQVLNLLTELQRDLGMAYLFISHDLSVVRHVSDTIAVMYLGSLVEVGPAPLVYEQPRHPYTQALVAAVPAQTPASRRPRVRARGEAPSPIDPPPGCPFHPRCPEAMDLCRTVVPAPRRVGDVTVTCHLYPDTPVEEPTAGMPVE